MAISLSTPKAMGIRKTWPGSGMSVEYWCARSVCRAGNLIGVEQGAELPPGRMAATLARPADIFLKHPLGFFLEISHLPMAKTFAELGNYTFQWNSLEPKAWVSLCVVDWRTFLGLGTRYPCGKILIPWWEPQSRRTTLTQLEDCDPCGLKGCSHFTIEGETEKLLFPYKSMFFFSFLF